MCWLTWKGLFEQLLYLLSASKLSNWNWSMPRRSSWTFGLIRWSLGIACRRTTIHQNVREIVREQSKWETRQNVIFSSVFCFPKYENVITVGSEWLCIHTPCPPIKPRSKQCFHKIASPKQLWHSLSHHVCTYFIAFSWGKFVSTRFDFFVRWFLWPRMTRDDFEQEQNVFVYYSIISNTADS